MKFLERLFLILAIILVVLGLVAFLLPKEWEVSVQQEINVPSNQIFPHLVNLKKWPEWTPWTKEKDPTLHYSYGDIFAGKGATQIFTSEKMGNGVLKINKVVAGQDIFYQLDFYDTSMQIFGNLNVVALGEISVVTWSDHGNLGNNPIHRYLGLFMVPMIRKELAEGLANLKRLVENLGHESQ